MQVVGLLFFYTAFRAAGCSIHGKSEIKILQSGQVTPRRQASLIVRWRPIFSEEDIYRQIICKIAQISQFRR
jgi:hypothetical protein